MIMVIYQGGDQLDTLEQLFIVFCVSHADFLPPDKMMLPLNISSSI
jgi:hypothetical protein